MAMISLNVLEMTLEVLSLLEVGLLDVLPQLFGLTAIGLCEFFMNQFTQLGKELGSTLQRVDVHRCAMAADTCTSDGRRLGSRTVCWTCGPLSPLYTACSAPR